MAARDGRRIEWEVTANGYVFSFWSDNNVLKFYNGDDCTTLWIYKNHWTVHFKKVILWYVKYQ